MLRIGVIGAGHLGKIHLRLWKEINDCILVGFYDHNAEHANQVSTDLGLQSFASVQELVDACDIIDIVTPTVSHFEYAVLALRNSKHIFIEKPITHALDEGLKLIAL